LARALNDAVRDLAMDAGPQDKELDHLKTLTEIMKIRRSGSLRQNTIEWFADNGISASYESEPKKTTNQNGNVELGMTEVESVCSTLV
jgi:hypothetical protein